MTPSWYTQLSYNIDRAVTDSVVFLLHIYHHISNIRRSLVGNKLADTSDVVGASPADIYTHTHTYIYIYIYISHLDTRWSSTTCIPRFAFQHLWYHGKCYHLCVCRAIPFGMQWSNLYFLEQLDSQGGRSIIDISMTTDWDGEQYLSRHAWNNKPMYIMDNFYSIAVFYHIAHACTQS